jgi:hypothetical protein
MPLAASRVLDGLGEQLRVHDPALGVGEHHADAAGARPPLVAKRQDRRGLRDPVALDHVHADRPVEGVHLGLQRAAARDAHPHPAAEFRADLSVDEEVAERVKGKDQEPGDNADQGINDADARLETRDAAEGHVARPH